MNRSLQGNRNQIRKFQIESVPYNMQARNNNMIKAHTCFNRLDVPLFPSKQELQENLRAILEQESYQFDFE
jgi:HECT-domain (ubiquitin-transferase)